MTALIIGQGYLISQRNALHTCTKHIILLSCTLISSPGHMPLSLSDLQRHLQVSMFATDLLSLDPGLRPRAPKLASHISQHSAKDSAESSSGRTRLTLGVLSTSSQGAHTASFETSLC